MDEPLESRIRERAYEIWTAHGCVHGQADQHWLAAEREIVATSTIPTAREMLAQETPIASAFEEPQSRKAGQLNLDYWRAKGLDF